MPYFAITYGAGETTVKVLSKSELKAELDAGNLGESFFSKRPDSIKPNEWAGKTLIVYGDVVSPTPVTKVVSWSVA